MMGGLYKVSLFGYIAVGGMIITMVVAKIHAGIIFVLNAFPDYFPPLNPVKLDGEVIVGPFSLMGFLTTCPSLHLAILELAPHHT